MLAAVLPRCFYRKFAYAKHPTRVKWFFGSQPNKEKKEVNRSEPKIRERRIKSESRMEERKHEEMEIEIPMDVSIK